MRSRYGKYGHLTRETDPVSGVDYWQAGSVNARGQLTADTLGGVWATSWSYHERSGQLLGINHVSPAAQRQLGYRYDVYGNLRQQVLNGGQSAEDYAYDDLHRLTQASRGGASNGSVSYGYDAVGNFRWKSDFSTMAGNAYGYSGSCGGGPNAVKSVQTAAGTRTYCYDANGNLTGDSAGLAVAYDHANLPVKTTRGTATLNFAYGPDGQRTRQWGAGGVRIYVSGYEDLPTTGETKVYVGDYAVITRTETTRSVRYLLKDRLGSVDAVGDEAGNLVETRGYDAFGKPRNGDWRDLTPPRLPTAGTTPKGFTQHEHLDAVELIHMNGRAYDYQLGRFLGVDPFIQFPLNGQSLNPYSYILNNPLSGTDPTGYQSCPVQSGRCHMPKEGEVRRVTETPTGSHIRRTVATVAGLPGGGVAISFGPGSGRAIAGFMANGAKTQGAMTAARADGVDPATKGGMQRRGAELATRSETVGLPSGRAPPGSDEGALSRVDAEKGAWPSSSEAVEQLSYARFALRWLDENGALPREYDFAFNDDRYLNFEYRDHFKDSPDNPGYLRLAEAPLDGEAIRFFRGGVSGSAPGTFRIFGHEVLHRNEEYAGPYMRGEENIRSIHLRMKPVIDRAVESYRKYQSDIDRAWDRRGRD